MWCVVCCVACSVVCSVVLCVVCVSCGCVVWVSCGCRVGVVCVVCVLCCVCCVVLCCVLCVCVCVVCIVCVGEEGGGGGVVVVETFIVGPVWSWKLLQRSVWVNSSWIVFRCPDPKPETVTVLIIWQPCVEMQVWTIIVNLVSTVLPCTNCHQMHTSGTTAGSSHWFHESTMGCASTCQKLS